MWIKQFFKSNERRAPANRAVSLDDLNLQRTFNNVVDVFFPKLDSGFRVHLVRDRAWTYRCCRKTKKISVNASRFAERDDLRAGLIQQLCYASTRGRPGEEWNEGMQHAAAHARKIGRPELAQRIDSLREAAWIDELEVYFDPSRDSLTSYDGNALLDDPDDIPTTISFEDSLRFSVLEREIRREEAELQQRLSRRKAAPSAA